MNVSDATGWSSVFALTPAGKSIDGVVACDQQGPVVGVEDEMVALRQWPVDVELLLHHVAEVECLVEHVEGVVLESRRLQHLFDQPVHLGQLDLLQTGHRRDLVWRYRALLQHRVVAADHRQRPAQLV